MRCVSRLLPPLITLLLLETTTASAQSARLKNIELCNGTERPQTDSQIKGCTALIESGNEKGRILAIAYNNRANAYSSSGSLDLAIQDYDRAIKIYPGYAKAFNNRGVAFGRKGEYAKALQDFDVAISLDPKYANAFTNRAEANFALSYYDRALEDYTRANILHPTADSFVGLCRVRTVTGDAESALADCSEAIRQDASSAGNFEARGVAYLKLGQMDLAISDFSEALRLQANRASSLYGRGMARVRNGVTDAGRADMDLALSVSPAVRDEYARYKLP